MSTRKLSFRLGAKTVLCTKADWVLIQKIANRAVTIDPDLDQTEVQMDIMATHHGGHKLDLSRLADVDDFNLMHDVYGIAAHLNRETLKLEDFFEPRLTLKEKAVS